MWYNVRMRAEQNGRHTSGAERLVLLHEIQPAMQQLTQRALQHANGAPDNVHVTIHALKEEPQQITALPVLETHTQSPEETYAILCKELGCLGLSAGPILEQFYTVGHLRGAMLLHTQSLTRLEPDKERGVRTSCMDYIGNTGGPKNHKKEALCLASKVLHHPDIIAELCISDDPDYTTGYLATKALGYVRLTNIKKLGDPHGGRIFLYAGALEDVPACIHYLEQSPVLVDLPI